MRAIARAASLAGIMALAPAASAQSLHVVRAEFQADGVRVGDGRDVPVRVVAWPRPDTATVEHVGSAITLRAEVVIAAPNAIGVGVGADTRLDTASPWQLTMLAGTWAAAHGTRVDAIGIALPATLPARTAWVPRGATPAAFVPRSPLAAAGPTPPGLGESVRLCHVTPLRPSATAAQRFAVPAETPAFRVAHLAHGLASLRVVIDGYVLEGVADDPRPCTTPSHGSGYGSGSGGASDGGIRGRAVTLPPGTPLYASATSPVPFATLLKPTFALGGGASGIVAWTIPVHEGRGPQFVLRAFVRTPAELLPDVDPAHPIGVHGVGLGFSDTHHDE